jgi:putative ABC transport system permease protein
MSSLRAALRILFRQPGYSLAVVLTLGLALAANLALFGVFDRMVLRPLNAPEPARVVRLWSNNPSRNFVQPALSAPKFRLFSENHSVFSALAASGFHNPTLIRPDSDPEQLVSLKITPGWFEVMGLRLHRGRDFNSEEQRPGGPAVVILSHDVWRNRFAGDESILGRAINLDGAPHTVVGILPPELPRPYSFARAFLPRAFEPPDLQPAQVEAGSSYLQVTARLRPGVELAAANAEIQTLAARYAAAFPANADAAHPNELRLWADELAAPVRAPLRTLLVAVALLLVVACVNVASLSLSRLVARRREVAVRLALGADRGRLVRGFLLESALLCGAATALGVLLGVWAMGGLRVLLASQLNPGDTFSLNVAVLLAAAGLLAATCLGVGLAPAWRASRANLTDALKDSGRGLAGSGSSLALRRGLVAAQVALSFALLVGAAFLALSLHRLSVAPLGFKADDVAGGYTILAARRYDTPDKHAAYADALLARLHGHPAVRHAAVANVLPVPGGAARLVYAVKGRPEPAPGERLSAAFVLCSENYHAMLGIPIRRGRSFTATDRRGAPLVALVNESLARKLFPAGDALGQVLRRGPRLEFEHEIVGLVADVLSAGAGEPPPDTVYLPFRQLPRAGFTIFASTPGDPAALQEVIRSAATAVDPAQAVAYFSRLADSLRDAAAYRRIVAVLTGVFASAALFHSVFGLHGALAYSVALRAREIGVRLALGAGRGRILRLVLREGLGVTAAGLLTGLLLAVSAVRLMRSFLHGVEPLDPLVYGAVGALFVSVALLACLWPAWRAARVDPLVALHA